MTVLETDAALVSRELPDALRELNDSGELDSADIQVALRLGKITGEADPQALTACALVVAATRLGSVCIDLSEVDAVDQAVIAASPLTAEGGPLRMVGTLLYLDRYYRYETDLAAELLARQRPAPVVHEALLAEGLDRLFPPDSADDGQQRLAAKIAVERQFCALAGGPGTGKTTTVAAIMALLHEQFAESGRSPLIALAAPTGRAAARLAESIAESDLLAAPVEASTLHRLLGWQPFNQSRFRHNRSNPLPHDAVIVDESSMISLSMMAQLVDAVGPDARLILVGDPRQLASIDAGSVFGDIAGSVENSDASSGVVVLNKVHRFGSAISGLASAVLAGDADLAIEVLRGGEEGVSWIETADDSAPAESRAAVTALARDDWTNLIDAAIAGDEWAATAALQTCRILCAHRHGPYGASAWNEVALRAVAAARPSVVGFRDEHFPGQPLMAVDNDYNLGIFNGDVGVVINDGTDADDGTGQTVAVFDRASSPLRISPQRLGQMQTAYAATVHKSQGSQFRTAIVVLPPEDSMVLTRELLYTAITRAQKTAVVVGSESALRAGIDRQIKRTSGLRERLWASTSTSTCGLWQRLRVRHGRINPLLTADDRGRRGLA